LLDLHWRYIRRRHIGSRLRSGRGSRRYHPRLAANFGNLLGRSRDLLDPLLPDLYRLRDRRRHVRAFRFDRSRCYGPRLAANFGNLLGRDFKLRYWLLPDGGRKRLVGSQFRPRQYVGLYFGSLPRNERRKLRTVDRLHHRLLRLLQQGRRLWLDYLPGPDRLLLDGPRLRGQGHELRRRYRLWRLYLLRHHRLGSWRPLGHDFVFDDLYRQYARRFQRNRAKPGDERDQQRVQQQRHRERQLGRPLAVPGSECIETGTGLAERY
jgi:hypothetical protein